MSVHNLFITVARPFALDKKQSGFIHFNKTYVGANYDVVYITHSPELR